MTSFFTYAGLVALSWILCRKYYNHLDIVKDRKWVNLLPEKLKIKINVPFFFAGPTLTAIVLFFILSPLKYEYPNPWSDPGIPSEVWSYDDRGQLTRYHPFGKWGANFINVPTARYYGSSIASAMTDNPKPVKLKYSYSIEIADKNVFYGKPGRKKLKSPKFEFQLASAWQVIGEIMRLLEYDFEHYESSGLVNKYFNPARSEHQKNFNIFIEDWFNEKIKSEGLAYHSHGFTLLD